jgi:hypothetical protein
MLSCGIDISSLWYKMLLFAYLFCNCDKAKAMHSPWLTGTILPAAKEFSWGSYNQCRSCSFASHHILEIQWDKWLYCLNPSPTYADKCPSQSWEVWYKIHTSCLSRNKSSGDFDDSTLHEREHCFGENSGFKLSCSKRFSRSVQPWYNPGSMALPSREMEMKSTMEWKKIYKPQSEFCSFHRSFCYSIVKLRLLPAQH